jgi:hypothetical protein
MSTARLVDEPVRPALLCKLLPHAERRTLKGEGHATPAEVLGPILEAFFLG